MSLHDWRLHTPNIDVFNVNLYESFIFDILGTEEPKRYAIQKLSSSLDNSGPVVS